MRVLVTGFGPFPGAPLNPSALLVKALARKRRPALAGIELITHVFPTSYAAVDRDLPKLLARKPDVVLLFGLAGRRRHLCIETRAQNAITLVYPDADRHRPQHGAMVVGAASSLRGNSPFMRLLSAVRGRFPVRLSRDAGRYLCNYVYWQALHRTHDGHPLVQFVHVPPVRVGPRRPQRHRRQSLVQLVRATEAILIELVAASRS
ncbi:MAG TPA: pyroglutamyl-peptidase I [Xanthobacteraceae bacterium]|nr:pyroglutamyl-peptidase I [Xanthobacteraceae bacterium]